MSKDNSPTLVSVEFELDEQDKKFIQSLVESGRYENHEAVIEAGLELLKQSLENS